MSKKRKFMMFVLLSFTSVFFAEVISGSMPFPLFDLWGYVVVIPLYGLHSLLLYALIVKFTKTKAISFVTIYAAGMIFGLYEAYITKVLWVGLAPDSFHFMELAIIDFIVLVFFWHPIFSFLLPLLVFESFMTSSRTVFIGLAPMIKRLITSRFGIVIILIVIGFFSAFNGVNPLHLLASFLALGIPILLLGYILRRQKIHHNYTLSDIIPKKLGLVVATSYLSLIYLVLTLYDRFEVITLQNQLVIWFFYLLFGTMLYVAIKQNMKRNPLQQSTNHLSSSIALYGLLIMAVSGVLFVFAFYNFGIRTITVISTWILWNIIGLILFGYSIKTLIRKKELR